MFHIFMKIQIKITLGGMGHAHYPVPREYFHKSKHKKNAKYLVTYYVVYVALSNYYW